MPCLQKSHHERFRAGGISPIGSIVSYGSSFFRGFLAMQDLTRCPPPYLLTGVPALIRAQFPTKVK